MTRCENADINRRFDQIERNQRRIADALKILLVRQIDDPVDRPGVWKLLPYALHGRLPEVGIGEGLSDHTAATLSELNKVGAPRDGEAR